jgi:hypothetical protein
LRANQPRENRWIVRAAASRCCCTTSAVTYGRGVSTLHGKSPIAWRQNNKVT